jgi:hypothetical protein
MKKVKQNLVKKKSEPSTTGVYILLDKQVKKDAQIWGLENKMSLTDIIIKGIGIVTGSKKKKDAL